MQSFGRHGHLFRLFLVGFWLFIHMSYGQNREAMKENWLKELIVHVEIKTEKSEFLFLEPIYINIELENRSKKWSYEIPSGPSCHLIIEDNKGRLFKPSMSFNREYAIPVGESKHSYFDIIYLYGVAMGESLRLLGLPVGNYTIQYKTGHIISNTIEVDIIAPIGDNQRSLVLFEEGRQLQAEKKYDLAEQKYNELVSQYPGTLYAGKALQGQLFLSKWIKYDFEKRLEISKLLLEQYPDYDYNKRAILNVILYHQNKNDLEGAKKYLSDLSHRTTNRKLREQLEKQVEKIEKGEIEY